MADFSVSDAAFAGFRFIKEKPLTILVWAVAYVVLMVVLFGVFFALAGAAFLPLISNPQAFENNPQQFLQSLPGLFGAIAVFAVVGTLAGGVVYAAVYRAFLRPEEGGLGYFRFGADELRLLGAYFLLLLLYLGVSIVGAVPVAGLAVGGGEIGQGLSGLLNLVKFCLLAWGAVRLSLALPATFATRRIALGESWRLTKGQFWKLTGAYLLAGAMLFAAYIAVVVLIVGIGGAAFAGLAAGANPAQVLTTSIPLLIALGLVYPVVAPCAMVVMIGPTAFIYRALSADPATTAETFA